MRTVVFAALVCACGGGVRIPAKPTSSLLEAGAEPRRVLRYVQSPGTTERIEITTKHRLHTAYTNTTLNEGSRDIDMPSIVVRGPMTIENVSAAGALISFTVDEVTTLEDVVDPSIRAAVIRLHDRALHQKASWRRGANGATEAVATVPGFEDLGVDAIEFPDEPLGIGASWRVTEGRMVRGVRWRVITTHRVVDMTPTTVTIDSDADFAAPEQALSVEPRATVHLTSGTGHFTSHSIMSLTGVFDTSESSSTLETKLLVTRGRLRVSATQTSELIGAVRRLTSETTP